jgi:hypothetical protein
MNVNSNIISRYDDMLYENRPASLNEFLSNKYNNVHNELYKSALNKFILSLVSKYVTKDFLYECFELLSEIDAYTEDEIIFENIYEKIFSKEDNSPLINYMLEELSIDRVSFFKTLYETTVNKLNSVKTKLINFYRDENYDIKSAIKGINEISDIQDFRLAYIISGIGSETNNERNIFTLYTDDDGELVVSNKVVFDDTTEEQEYINKDMYYYVSTEMPTEDMNIQNDDRWHQCSDNGDIYDPILEWSLDNTFKFSDYYIAIPSGYGIYRHYLQSVEKERWNDRTLEYEKYQINAGDEIEQISLSAKSPYTFIKSIIINKVIYNVYITSMINGYNDIFNDIIKVNPESIVSNVIDDFDLICSEDKEYIILYDFENNVRIGYDEDGKWLLIVNDDHPINTIDILGLERIVKQYMNYESKTLLSLYKNMICDLYKKYHKIIEIKNSEYWMPSHIRIINKIPPYTKINVDLSKYWNMIQSNNTSKLSDLKITNENMLDSELIGLNYVNGKAKVQSRTNDTIYEVPFKYLDETVNVSDEMILSNSFISKYNNL